MIRISGINIPNTKKIYISLTHIFGIGISTSKNILKNTNININKITSNLTDLEISYIRNFVENSLTVEGDLKEEISLNIKRLIENRCYRGIRHYKKLPVRGQKTHSNAKTCKKTNKKY
jgi:small subunit ribosomal protein S13